MKHGAPGVYVQLREVGRECLYMKRSVQAVVVSAAAMRSPEEALDYWKCHSQKFRRAEEKPSSSQSLPRNGRNLRVQMDKWL